MNNNSRFRKNFLDMFFSNILGRAAAFIAIPVLTRLYTPEDFAVVAIFIAISSYFFAITTLRIEWHTPNCKNEEIAVNTIVLSLIVLFILTSASFTLFLLFFNEIQESYPAIEVISPLLYLLPILVVLEGLKSIFSSWYIFVNKMEPIAKVSIFQPLSHESAKLGFGIISPSPLSLISSRILSLIVSNYLLIKLLGENFKTYVLKSLQLKKLKDTFISLKKEIPYSVSVSLINVVGTSLPIILFSQYLTLEQLGWYSLVILTAGASIGILSNAMAQSFWGHASSLMRDNKIDELRGAYLKTTKNLFLLSIPLIIITLSSSHFLVTLLGQKWEGSGYVLAATTPQLVALLVFSSTNHFVVYKRQDLQLYSDIFLILMFLLVFYLCKENEVHYLITISLTSAVYFVSYLFRFYLHLHANKSIKLVN